MTSDYLRIERAMHYIATHVGEQPSLERLAAEVDLSPHHFQRLFTRWVGVSPKKFLQYLTLDRAKVCLEMNASVLDAAHEAGLSGPGRLHDLFVTVEAVTPGEFKLRGEGLTIDYGWAASPFGDCLVLATGRGLCGLGFAFPGKDGRAEAFEDMRRRWPRARFVENPERAEVLVRELFRPRRSTKPVNIVLYGSPFQVKVWEALLTIPPGAVVTYDALAQAIGRPSAARAVGGAVGANPISWLIPCHRVIRKTAFTGDARWFSGYNWGPARKLAMLGWEGVNADRAPQRKAG
jgi:AraC family transcriptional regulator of adaptative response/methylated-DNA-[protein]-cysteine methyltransferase